MLFFEQGAVHRLVASQYKIAPDKLMRTGINPGIGELIMMTAMRIMMTMACFIIIIIIIKNRKMASILQRVIVVVRDNKNLIFCCCS